MFDSDRLIDTIRKHSGNMSFDEYASRTGLDKDLIFDILKGRIEKVDEDTFKKLMLQ